MGGDGSEAAYSLLFVILILLKFDERRRIEPAFVVALVDFGSKKIGRSLLFLCLLS